MPSELSGGEQQRIGILRAFACEPQVVLMDEAFMRWIQFRTQLQNLVLKMHTETKTTIVFVTHDMNEAMKLEIGWCHGQWYFAASRFTNRYRSESANELVSELFANSGSKDVL